MKSNRRGFTLVELLVVIAILATLAGLVTATLATARRSAAKKNCRLEIDRLSLAVSTYESDFGDYPPSDLESAYEVVGNGINSGIESLVAHLSTRNQGGPYFEFKEGSLANLDGDVLDNPALVSRLNWQFGDNQLREYLDPWGNPYIYIHNRDYRRSFSIQGETGAKALVKAGFSEASVQYYSFTKFQIFSLGPDAKSQNGGGDDIGSWN